MSAKDEVGQRRRWRRYHLTVPVRVTIEKFLHVSVIDGLSFKMSDGGLEVCADTELRIGDKANFEFKPPHFDRLTLRGVIRHHKGNFYGVEFLATSSREREKLDRFRQVLRTTVGPFDGKRTLEH